ncbi:MAG: amino acid permease-domain-containing protein [Monoraphidium minutum]|nr:MAG: amino acid permease-domain-containing protein [Monoraphidium minutum]
MDLVRGKSEQALRAASHHVWHGPSWMSRLAGAMPHEAPREGTTQMKKVMGLFSLTMMSTAAIVGSGIFVLTGVVAKNYAGPGVVLSFLISGAVAMLSAMCYMEFSSETPTAGASIVYTSKIYGKFFAWIVAINVLMELVIASAAVATGFSGYLSSLIKTIDAASPAPRLAGWSGTTTIQRGGLDIDLVAAGAVLLITLLLVLGVQQAEFVQIMCTGTCLVAIVLSIIMGFVYSDKANWSPFTPLGFDGVFRGASVVFFAYLGFEMMATGTEDSVNGKRDIPLAIAISVGGCTILYLLMALAVTGMIPYASISERAPFSDAFRDKGSLWMSIIVGVGGLMGILDTIVVTQYSMSRTFVVLGRMGLVPPVLSNVHPKTQTPIVSVVFCGAISSLLALFVPITALADLTSMGALFAFCVVCSAVMFRRYYQPPSVPLTTPGMTGAKGAPLPHILVPFLSIVGASIGLGFGVATGAHWGVYVAMAAWWLGATVFIWLALPVVFRPNKLSTPLFPFWPSLGVLTTIFLIASLGPANWARWGYGLAVGAGLYLIYGAVELIYNRIHGPPPPPVPEALFDDEPAKGGALAAAKDLEADPPHA